MLGLLSDIRILPLVIVFEAQIRIRRLIPPIRASICQTNSHWQCRWQSCCRFGHCCIRGAFYHVYKNLEELHSDLINDWRTRNTEPLLKTILEAAPDGRKQLLAWDTMIQFEQDYNPVYDNVIRDWARISPSVKDAVRQIDTKRINVLQDIYLNLGYDEKTAEFRAKIMYYHQIGYQTLEVEESLDQRLVNAPYYAEIISENPQKYPYNNAGGVLSIMKSNRVKKP